jgi:myo-inositol-1(or 4)-monophosphatase
LNIDFSFQLAMEAVTAAGKVLKKGFHKKKSVQKKGTIDLVTEWDFKSQETVLAILKLHFPDADYLVEESGSERRPSPYCWVLDPLDGTTNFVHGFPFFCVSLALNYEKVPLLGIIYNPELGETYWAIKGQGAFFNGRPMRVSSSTKVSESLLATGFPYNIKKTHGPILKRLERVIRKAQGIRRPGSAALDLSWVAKGVLDGFWEEYLKPWDTAAGLLLVEEAGGRVSDFSGRPFDPRNKQIVATNGLIHQEILDLLDIQS